MLCKFFITFFLLYLEKWRREKSPPENCPPQSYSPEICPQEKCSLEDCPHFRCCGGRRFASDFIRLSISNVFTSKAHGSASHTR